MSGFVDRALLQLHDPAALTTLLTGGAAAPYPRLARLITTLYDTDAATIDHVQAVTVASTEPMVQIAVRTRICGTFTTSQPAHGLSDLRADLTAGDGPWAHLLAHVSLHVAIEVDPGGIESVVMTSIENITSLADFASRFRYLDLDAFLATHKITTVEQLQEAAQYLLAEVRLKPPPAFDPQSEANAYDVAVPLAITIVEEADLAAGLTAARQLLDAGKNQPPAPASAVLGAAHGAYAVAVVLPAKGPPPPDPAAVDALYAKAGVLPLFADPP